MEAGARALLCHGGARLALALAGPSTLGGSGCGLSPTSTSCGTKSPTRARRAIPLASGIVARRLDRALRQRRTEGEVAASESAVRRSALFALGYSEPEAGSDLASVRVQGRARDGDEYYRDQRPEDAGSPTPRTWTICGSCARTGSQESRGPRAQLLMIVTCNASPASRSSPAAHPRWRSAERGSLRGRARFRSTNRVGPENGAWKIMGEALADERHIQFPPGRVRRDLEEVVEWVRGRGWHGDPARAPDARGPRRATVREAEMLWACWCSICHAARSQPGAVEAAANKVVSHHGLPEHRARDRSTSADPRRWSGRARRAALAPEHVGDDRRGDLGDHARHRGQAGPGARRASLSQERET